MSHSLSRRPHANRSSSASSGRCGPEPGARLQVANLARGFRCRPGLGESGLRLGGLAAREQDVDERHAAVETRKARMLEPVDGVRLGLAERATPEKVEGAQLRGERERGE
jgi:hypothetical protein